MRTLQTREDTAASAAARYGFRSVQPVLRSSEEIYIEAFRKSIEFVGPEPLLLVNLPAFYEVVDQNNKSGPVRAPKYFRSRPAIGGVALHCADDWLPASSTYEEKYSWFTLPWDGIPRITEQCIWGYPIKVGW